MRFSLGSSGLKIFILHLFAASLCGIPFFVTSIPGMIDYPNHLAHFYILTLDCQSPTLDKFYNVRLSFLPNMGLEVIVVALDKILHANPIILTKFVVMLSTLALIPMVGFIHSAISGRWSYVTMASSVIVYNYVVIYGFLNYMAGVSLAMLAAGHWIKMRKGNVLVLLPLYTAVAFVLSIVHLLSLGIYAILIGGFEVWDLTKAKGRRVALVGRQLVLFLHLLPALLLPFLFSPVVGNVSVNRIKWSSLWDKAIAIYSVVDLGEPWIGILTFVLLSIVFGGLILARQIAISTPGIVMLGLLTLAFLFMPFTAFGLGFADYRLPIVIAAVGIAALRWTGRSRAVIAATAFVIFALTVLRVGFITFEWHRAGSRYGEIIEATKIVEPGKRLKTVIAAEDITRRFFRRPPIDHASAFTVISRHTFVPTLFAEPEKQLVVFTPNVAHLAKLNAVSELYSTEEDPLSMEALAEYDYVLVFAHMPLRRQIPKYLIRIDDGKAADVMLFTIQHSDGRLARRWSASDLTAFDQAATPCDEK